MKHPFHQIHLYEIGSRIFCTKKGKPLREVLVDLERKTPFVWADEIWLMGVWKNSPSSQKIARSMPELQPGYQSVKSNFEPKDVYGSPYSIYDYVPDPLISESNHLTEIHNWFASKNKKLILDFVPNHMAIDSPLVSKYPDYFLKADSNKEDKNTFLHPNGFRYCYGKDPYFDGWTDTIQWDFSNPEVETYHTQLLRKIAEQCDGVRCDMAMLPLPEVFEKTHGKKSVYDWERVIRTIKKEFPEFRFYAEVYWGLEVTLRNQGFDATYDKSLYDALHNKDLHQTYDLISKNSELHSIRFLENHDEGRAEITFGDNAKTYFSLLSASPCTILFYDGQELGLTKKIPVQIIGIDEEKENQRTKEFYTRIFSVITNRSNDAKFSDVSYSEFHYLPIFARLITSQNQTELILWNFHKTTASGWIHYQEGITYQKELKDLVSGETFSQEKKEDGIYYKLEPNQLQWFTF